MFSITSTTASALLCFILLSAIDPAVAAGEAAARLRQRSLAGVPAAGSSLFSHSGQQPPSATGPRRRTAFAGWLNAPPDSTPQPNAKNPNGAMLRSAIFPGWGQWYNGKHLKSMLVFALEAGIVLDAVRLNQRVQAKRGDERAYWQDRRNLRFWWLAAATLLSMLDAYVDAQLADFDESPAVLRTAPAFGAANDGALTAPIIAVSFSF